MALYREDIADVELKSGNISRSFLKHTIGKGDNKANRFGVRVFRNKESEDLTGATCQGIFMAPDGQNILISGSGSAGVAGNVAWVQLPQACYNVEGQFALAIKLIGGGVTGTMRIIDGVVDNTGVTGAVAPTGAVPTYQEVLAAFDDAIDAIDTVNRFEDVIAAFNALGLLPNKSAFPATYDGVTYTYTGNGFVHLSGKPTDRQLVNFITVNGSENIPDAFKGIDDAVFCIEYRNRTTTYQIEADLYIKTESNPSYYALINDAKKTSAVSIPSDITGILIRVDIPGNADVTFDDEILLTLIAGRAPNFKHEEDQFALVERSGLTETDLNKVIGNHDWLMSTEGGREYIHKPDDYSNNTGFLSVRKAGAYHIQILYEFTGGRMWKRRDYGNNGASWEAWHLISGEGGGGGGTVIENTYNITTSPTITTDANGWLQAVDTDTQSETGKTDMTGPIMSMLTDTGYCHLGEGIFYVSGNIDMPEGSMLCGCGDKTQIRLLQSTTTGYCVKLTDYSTIKDVSFSGSYSEITPTTLGTRDGVHFVGGYESTPQKRCTHCVIENVIFRNFSGAGLLCDETSLSPEDGLYATNLFFTNCYAGIYIRRYSEFNKFTNVCTTKCFFGVINNGGNNVFTACTLRATQTAFYIDGSAPNSAHGTINGCTFCHTGENAGSAITMENVTAGFVVSDCQFWYNSVDLTNCNGIAFSGCEFGNGITGTGKVIGITGGNTVMFTGCLFKDDPVITISNNSKVKFTGCFERDSGDAVMGQ